MYDFRSQLKSLTSPIIVGIAGDSGSGKTTYSNGIRRLLGIDIVQTITMDGYHKENRAQRQISGRLPLDPQANRFDELKSHLSALKEGKTVDIPTYNHASGDFDKPVTFAPSPIIILEGLHALYPEFLPFFDFTIYADPNRQVKWDWKYERDIEERGHDRERLSGEMYKREMAYKRWIDFQKTDADVVVKIFPSRIRSLARYELLNRIPPSCYNVELLMEPAEVPLPTITLPFDLSNILNIDQPPFLLAAVPSVYWGKKVTVIHLDGIISQQTVAALEKHIASLTNMPVESAFENKYNLLPQAHEQLTAVQFAQLLIAWRFLETVGRKLVDKK